MNLKIQNRNWELAPSLERVIQRKSQKLRKMLPTFASEVLDLHVSLEKLPRGRQYQTILVLTTPQTAIRVEEIEENPASSVLRAYVELVRRIKKFKSQLSRERFWQRQTRQVEGAFSDADPGDLQGDLQHVISQHLDKVENYIRRDLFHQAMVEDLPRGLLEPQALVDEVFLELNSKARRRPENLSIEQWMFRTAREMIRRRIRQWEVSREERHLEESARTETGWDDEALNFYQPDEVLHLEDLLRDNHSVDPEELLAREETEEVLQQGIAHLPASIRESFVLFVLEGFNSDEVAMITGKAPVDVLREVEQAREQLRRQIQTVDRTDRRL